MGRKNKFNIKYTYCFSEKLNSLFQNDVGEENYIAMNAADKRSGAP